MNRCGGAAENVEIKAAFAESRSKFSFSVVALSRLQIYDDVWMEEDCGVAYLDDSPVWLVSSRCHFVACHAS